MMIKVNDKIVNCDNCKNKTKNYIISINKKKFCLCGNCLNIFYKEIGGYLVPKSPKSILKKDNRIKFERF